MHKRLAGVLLLAITVAACGGDDDDGSDGGDVGSPGPVVIAEPIFTTTTTEPVVGAPVCGASMEGCYGKSQMQFLADAIIPFVETFAEDTYTQMPTPAKYIYVATGETGEGACLGGYNDWILAYCGGDNYVYLGQESLWDLYSVHGDAAPVLVLAHEWGHHVQEMVGVPDANSNAETIPRENQSDCFAGAFMKYAQEQGWMELPDDIVDIGDALVAAGELDGPARTHGTKAERLESFNMGFRDGVFACNAFFPNTPLATAS